MKKSMLFLALCAACGLWAQSVPNANFNETEEIICPFDSSETITAYKDWLIYQTLDGKWDGPVDSSRCLTVLPSSPASGISIENADPLMPIFLRSKLNDSNKILLEKNQPYAIESGQWNNEVKLKTGMDCPGNLCSGLIIGMEIPDSTGLESVIRWYTDIASPGDEKAFFSTCIPTEYFDSSYLRHYIIKMTPNEDMAPDELIKMGYAKIQSYGWPNYVEEITAPESSFSDTSYNVRLTDLGLNSWNFDYLLLYTDTDNWPSTAHLSYVEAQPQVNSPEPKTINLTVEEGNNFMIQPFAAIRGALVEGSDSIRHEFNLINNGGDMCLGSIIDFVFDNGTKYIHQGGHVDFGHRSACFMFQNGAALEVADNTYFKYGQEGKGILALRPGSTIKLGKESQLVIDNTLWLQGRPTAQFPDHQIYMELNKGSTLSFTENAHIYNSLSFVEGTKLNVFMNGGILDDTKLPAADRALINRIYPKPKPIFSENIKLLQNPVNETLALSFLSAYNGELIIEVYDFQGRVLDKKNHEVFIGKNELSHDIHGLPSGIYLAKIKGGNGEAVVKFIKAG